MRSSENEMYNDAKACILVKARGRLREPVCRTLKHNWKKKSRAFPRTKQNCAIQLMVKYRKLSSFPKIFTKYTDKVWGKFSGKFIPRGIWQHRYNVVTPWFRFRNGWSITYIFSKSEKVKSENFHANFAKIVVT